MTWKGITIQKWKIQKNKNKIQVDELQDSVAEPASTFNDELIIQHLKTYTSN